MQNRGKTSKKRKIEYLEYHINYVEISQKILRALRKNGGLDWLTDDQLADVINLTNREFRFHQKLARQNRRNLKND